MAVSRKQRPAKGPSGSKSKRQLRTSVATAPVRVRAAPLVIGIGASAGGLDAFRTFFSHMPAHTGMAFVLVQHLAPDHPSILADLIRRQTPMTVVEGSDRMQVAENSVFVIPPNATLTIKDRVLRVSRPAPPRESRRPIDTFFAALAEDQKECAVCIVLSGTGTDGTIGLRAVKEHGGLTLAQSDAGSDVLSGMPHSAASTGLVDHMIPVADMPKLLVDYQKHLKRVASKKDGDGNRRDMAAHLSAVCTLVRRATGHDFSQYKPATLMRRIQRRMQVLRIDTVPEFTERLRQEPQQLDLLLREFLIGVTEFFRDPSAYEALQKGLRTLLDDKDPDDTIRIWVPGCATGEEVYSIAIVVKEELQRRGVAPRVQIFGTDIDEKAIAVARAGRYHKKLEGVSAERVKRWFVAEGSEYCPLREIREMCVFSSHNVIKDPPFSRMDLISCRNLFIYFEVELQERLLQTFHYALRPRGYLFLGQSEGVARSNKIFEPVDEKHRIFRHRSTAGAKPAFSLEGTVREARAARIATPQHPIRAVDLLDAEIRSIMEKHSPAHVVIDAREEIVRFSGGQVARYLEPSPGAASLNLLSIVRKELRPTVRAAIQRARKQKGPVASENTVLRIDGHQRTVKLIVEPVGNGQAGDAGRWLIAFQELAAEKKKSKANPSSRSASSHVDALENELLEARTRLSAAIEELATTHEETKSASEEFQSVNEELQSSNEELETAKEEMQSVNEELQTINAEMLAKNAALTRLNSDLKNLLDSTPIATLFLDLELRIRSFTPGMTGIFNLRDTDLGRPITDISGGIDQAALRADMSNVLRSLTLIEREVSLADRDTVFLMHVRPYLSVDGILDGVVLTFVDITERKRHEEAWGRLAAIVESSQDAIIGHTLKGVITSWNTGAEAIFGYTAEEAIGEPFSILIPQARQDDVPQILESLQRSEPVNHFEIDRVRKDGKRIDVSLTISPVKDARGNMIAASTVARDITERKLAQDHQSMLMAELDHRIKNTLMIITSLIAQTIKSSESPEAFGHIIEGRIQALSRSHGLLNQTNWDRASLRRVIAGELEPYQSGDDSIAIEGNAEVMLTPKATQTLSLALHELATNAAKYGALSTAAGQVVVRWKVTSTSAVARLVLEWIESGGPQVRPPTRRGFGSDLIERVVRGELQAEVRRSFEADGVRCTIELPLTSTVGSVLPSAAG